MSVSKHIFIAEDEANISDFLKRGLEDCGYEVSVASNGNEAWLMMEDGMLEGAVLHAAVGHPHARHEWIGIMQAVPEPFRV